MGRRKKVEEFQLKDEGAFVKKTSCPKCGSHDNLAVYVHDDGTYSASCFGTDCGYYSLNWDIDNNCPVGGERREMVERVEEVSKEDYSERIQQIKDDYIAVDLKDRKLRADVLDKYGVKVKLNDDGETVDAHYYPTYRMINNVYEQVGFRQRKRFPEGHEKAGILKDFSGTIGDAKKGITLFGQWLYDPEQYKRIILFEGEIDAMTGQTLIEKGQKVEHFAGCVSTPSGANIQWIKPHLAYLSSFKEIYLCIDNDEAGHKFLDDLVHVLPIGKVKIINLPKGFKDVNEWWTSGKTGADFKGIVKNFWNALWGAKNYSPAGIKSFSEGWSDYLNRGQDILIPFPDSFGELNLKTFGGYSLAEIVTIAAPSSVGKSSFIKEMIYTALQKTPYKIGICSFEETLDEFIEGMLSVHMSQQLSEIPFDKRDRAAEWKAFQELIKMKGRHIDSGEEVEEDNGERMHYLDHQGACDSMQLLEKIDFLIKGCDCKIIIVDPVTLALANSDMDEDEFASEIVKRVKREKVAWINVHHVRKNNTGAKANSEGGDLAEEDMKGSGTWFQTSMINLILTRNKVHRNEVIKNTTTIKMTKCRRHGKNTGIAGWTWYNGETGRLELGKDPREIEKEMQEDEENAFAAEGRTIDEIPEEEFGKW